MRDHPGHAIRRLDSGVAKSRVFGDPAARLYRVVLYKGRAEGTATDGSFPKQRSIGGSFALATPMAAVELGFSTYTLDGLLEVRTTEKRKR